MSLFDYFVEGSDFIEKQELGKQFINRLAAYVNLVVRDILIDQQEDANLRKILGGLDHRLSSYKARTDDAGKVIDPISAYVLSYNKKKLEVFLTLINKWLSALSQY